MRIKLLVIILSILLITSSCSQKTTILKFISTNSENYPCDAYDYTEGSQQIPESILKNMSTRGLVVSVLNYPALPEIDAYSSPQGGVSAIVSKFTGLQELMRRNDAGTEMFTIYRSMGPTAINHDWEPAHRGRYVNNFKYIELILSQDSILDDFTEGELKELLREAKKKFEKKLTIENFRNRGILSSLLLIGRILQEVNFQPYKSEVLKNEILKEFMDNGYYLDETSLNFIVSCGEQYLSNEAK